MELFFVWHFPEPLFPFLNPLVTESNATWRWSKMYDAYLSPSTTNNGQQ